MHEIRLESPSATAMDGANHPKRWVIYSTYSLTGEAAPYVVEQIEHYMALGFDVLIVDTSVSISKQRGGDWSRLSPNWFQRLNSGYDFASYQAGLQSLVDTRAGSTLSCDLLFTNDSCFGPFFPLQRVFAKFGVDSKNTIFGITDSFEIAYHLQSYWLYFPADVSRLALEFFGSLDLAADRDAAIETGEIGLSRYLLDRGKSLKAYAPVDEVMRGCARRLPRVLTLIVLGLRRLLKRYRYTRRGDGACIKYLLGKEDSLRFVNPTLDFGPVLFKGQLSPFIKRALLRSNPVGDRSLAPSMDISRLSNADAACLLREGRPGTPARLDSRPTDCKHHSG